MILYASENWTIQQKHVSEIDATEMEHLRKIAEKTKWDRININTKREITGQGPVMQKIEKIQLYWYGYVIRMDKESI